MAAGIYRERKRCQAKNVTMSFSRQRAPRAPYLKTVDRDTSYVLRFRSGSECYASQVEVFTQLIAKNGGILVTTDMRTPGRAGSMARPLEFLLTTSKILGFAILLALSAKVRFPVPGTPVP